MKFDHIVKYNDVYYQAGEDVPMEEKVEKPVAIFSAVEETHSEPIKRRGRKPREE